MCIRDRRKKELEAAERLKIYTDIDRADEAVLDILAVQFRVDWYDTCLLYTSHGWDSPVRAMSKSFWITSKPEKKATGTIRPG